MMLGVVLGPVVVESGWDDAAGVWEVLVEEVSCLGGVVRAPRAVIAKQYELGTEGIAQLLSTERIAQFARMAVGDWAAPMGRCGGFRGVGSAGCEQTSADGQSGEQLSKRVLHLSAVNAKRVTVATCRPRRGRGSWSAASSGRTEVQTASRQAAHAGRSLPDDCTEMEDPYCQMLWIWQ